MKASKDQRSSSQRSITDAIKFPRRKIVPFDATMANRGLSSRCYFPYYISSLFILLCTDSNILGSLSLGIAVYERVLNFIRQYEFVDC
jgi:hypothetical protein